MRSTPDAHRDAEFELVVSTRRTVADRVCVLTLSRPDGSALPRWSPGAHIDLVLGAGLVRQYSLCGDPHDAASWQVAVLLEEQSRGGSATVHRELTAGTSVRARGPRNHFPLVSAPRYLFVAGGIGIAPLVPMVATADSAGADWRLVYGGRRRSAMAFADTLAESYDDKVHVLPEDETGLLPLEPVVRAADDSTAIYCCGPASLTTEVEKLHADAGKGTLHVERFGPQAAVEPEGRGTFEVEAARSGTVVTVGPDTTVLEALRSAGVDVLSACTEGICGTCEVKVLAGTPEHRDSILTEQERAAGDTMFVCVSRCLSRRLLLDV